MFHAIPKERPAKKLLENKHCILCVSMGALEFEGDKLSATIQMINHLFSQGQCTIMLADSLQRFNLLHQNPDWHPDLAHKKAIQLGQAWRQRNQKFLKQLKIPSKIIHWDQFLTHPEFPNKLALLEHHYQTNPDFEKAIHKTVNAFVGRHLGKKIAELNLQKQSASYQDSAIKILKAHITHQSYGLVKEECAVMLLWGEYFHFHFILYPNYIGQALTFTKEIVQQKYPDKIEPLEIQIQANTDIPNNTSPLHLSPKSSWMDFIHQQILNLAQGALHHIPKEKQVRFLADVIVDMMNIDPKVRTIFENKLEQSE